MTTPPSPPPASPTSTPTPIPLTSPLRTHPKRGLPPTLSSTIPHGHISGHPRTGAALAAFEARKAEIMHTMSAQQIEAEYEKVVKKIREVLEADEERGREVEREVHRLRMEREMERRVFGKFKGGKEGV